MIRLYVISCRLPNGRRAIYVGSTAKPLETRLREHAEGRRYCPTCHVRHTLPEGARAVRLRPDLLPRRTSFATRREAALHEKRLAAALRARGFGNVLGGH